MLTLQYLYKFSKRILKVNLWTYVLCLWYYKNFQCLITEGNSLNRTLHCCLNFGEIVWDCLITSNTYCNQLFLCVLHWIFCIPPVMNVWEIIILLSMILNQNKHFYWLFKIIEAWIYIFHVICIKYKCNVVKNKYNIELWSVIFNLVYLLVHSFMLTKICSKTEI